MRLEKDCKLTCLKKGVIDFDLGKDGEIVISNGKYLLKQDRAGKEKLIGTIDLINRLRVRYA